MSPSTLVYEAQLELESLNFLDIVGESSKLSETKRLANILTGKALTQTKQVLGINASGNYGIALNSIIMNKLTMTEGSLVVAALMSYWALNNHIEHDIRPLLIQNRGLLMYSLRDLFYHIYRKAMSDIYSPHSIVYSVVMSSVENTVNRLITYDFYCVKEDYPIAEELYKEMAGMLGITPANFHLAKYYTDQHLLLKKEARKALEAM